MKYAKTVDEFLNRETRWKNELVRLREIVRQTEMEETIKWGIPVYTVDGKNVAGIGSFKSYFGLWFYNGVFLKDRAKKLISAQDGKTKALRQWRFTSMDQIDENLILRYLEEAIENQRKGRKLKPERKPDLEIPSELAEKLNKDQKLKKAFSKFTTYKQREFADYISSAKREQTKQNRLEKIVPMILENVGLNDKYK